jgi:hypothetical protein
MFLRYLCYYLTGVGSWLVVFSPPPEPAAPAAPAVPTVTAVPAAAPPPPDPNPILGLVSELKTSFQTDYLLK